MVFSFFFRKRGRTLRASLLLRSRVTLTLGLRRRKRRRRIAARTPVICATRFSRRAALCLDTNMNTQVNTHATFHKAFQRLRLNKHATRNHSLLGGNMSQSLSNRTENGDFFFAKQCRAGWTPPFQQVLLNMYRGGLRVRFRQLSTSASFSCEPPSVARGELC